VAKSGKLKLSPGIYNISSLEMKGARFVHHSSTASFPKESEVGESEVAKFEVVTDYVLFLRLTFP